MCALVFVKYPICSVFVLCAIVIFPSIKGNGCNEFVCGSVVSKCLLTRSCQCKLADCYCCKDCFNCLGTLFTECCSCLEICPKHNATLRALAPMSQSGDFEGVPELFDTLTAEDNEDQWTTVRFPMNSSVQRHYNMATKSFGFGNVNCTVIFLNTCTTNKKCLQDCASMGSNSYRWFHDGCCECVGANCYNYGINESRCTACPDDDEDGEDINGENVDDGAEYAGEYDYDMSWD